MRGVRGGPDLPRGAIWGEDSHVHQRKKAVYDFGDETVCVCVCLMALLAWDFRSRRILGFDVSGGKKSRRVNVFDPFLVFYFTCRR